MQTGEGRILTTHTGSLPRPASLRRLLVQRARGESVDEAALEAEIRAAKQWVVRQQRAAGIDIGNDGEQGRESFFLSVRHRLSGFGGSWQRPPAAMSNAIPPSVRRSRPGLPIKRRSATSRPRKPFPKCAIAAFPNW